jgi:histidyl-tRNA synthetase
LKNQGRNERVEELRLFVTTLQNLDYQQQFQDLDVTLARGIKCATGAIFEVAPPKSVQWDPLRRRKI